MIQRAGISFLGLDDKEFDAPLGIGTGSGLGGVIAVEKLHQLKPDIKILIIEKGYFGYTGQSTKAGHGMVYLTPGDDIEAFCEEQVRHKDSGI